MELIGHKYRIIDICGTGNQATVYKVADMDSGNIYACKEIAEDKIDGWKMVKDTSADGCVSVREIIEDKGTVYVIMDYINGHTLSDYISLNSPEIDSLIKIAKRIAQILGNLNMATGSYIYMDLKPENIMISDDNVYLIDFDALRRVTDSGYDMMLTPAYAAPECLWGKFSTQSDVYSYGKLMIYIFTGLNPMDINVNDLEDFLDNCDLPSQILRIIRKCTEDRIDDRYGDCNIVYEEMCRMGNRYRNKQLILTLCNYMCLIPLTVMGTLCIKEYIYGNRIYIYLLILFLFLTILKVVCEIIMARAGKINRYIRISSVELNEGNTAY